MRFDLSVLSALPILGLQSLCEYKPPKERKDAKAGKEVARPHRPFFPPPCVVAGPNLFDFGKQCYHPTS